VIDDTTGALLSAHLDGELTPDEQREVERLVAEDPEAALELDALRTVRARLRAAPPVDPPFGLYERMLRAGNPEGKGRRGVRVRWLASAVATAAVWMLVLGFGVDLRGRPVDPEVDQARAAFVAGAAGGDDVLVVERPGEVDWSKLRGGERGPLEGLPGRPWRSIDPTEIDALVFQGDGVAVVVVGDEPLATLLAVAVALPDQGDASLGARLRDGCDQLLDVMNG
jgi:anti-sigma factor RsiW